MNKTKKPLLAAALNLLPGLGYIYLKKRMFFGISLLVGGLISLVAAWYNPLLADYYNSPFNKWDWIGLLGALIFYAGFIYDAYKEAKLS